MPLTRGVITGPLTQPRPVVRRIVLFVPSEETLPEPTLPEPTRLAFIRHGQANSWERRVVGGPTGCTGLTDTGRRQCEVLRDRLARTGEMAGWTLLSSALPRAMETANLVMSAVDGIAPVIVDDLSEMRPGSSDGMAFGDYQATMAFDTLAEPDRPIAPGGESLVAFDRRIRATVDDLVARYAGRRLVVVSHAGFITGASRYLLEARAMYERSGLFLELGNGSVTEWHVSRSPGVGATLVRFNDTAHLANL